MAWLAKWLQWTYAMRCMGVAILVHETLRSGGLTERPTLVIGAFGLVGLHEVVKRDRDEKGKKT